MEIKLKTVFVFVIMLFIITSCDDNSTNPSDCSLYKLNKSIGDTLIVADVNLGVLPSCIGNMENLKFVGLVNNNLITLPLEFFKLKNLFYFFSINNQFDTIPDKFDKLTNLRFFIVTGSNLKHIPSSLFKNKELHHLDLSASQMESVPDEIGTMTKLNWLTLSSTKVSTLPSSIKNLKGSLKYLSILDTNIPNSFVDTLRVWLPETDIFYNIK